MDPVYYVIAVLGCGEGQAPCQPVEVADARFESREACLAATEAALGRVANLDFPIVVAECRAEGAAAAPLRPADIALPDPHRRPRAPDR